MKTYDIAVIGSGFGGALMSMSARRAGRSVLLLERDQHPRFAMGESSTPLTNLFLEEIADRFEIPELRAFSKWGTWQKSRPDVAVGLKRGFTFYHHERGQSWQPRPDRSNELLVAASPNDDVADTHWYRADFDQQLVRAAQARGVEYLDQTRLTGVEENEDGMRLRGHRLGSSFEAQARWVIDASGAHGFLHRHFGLNSEPWPGFPVTETLYSHFRGVKRWADLRDASEPSAPYPPDDAAVHHIFDGGWIWVLRFNNGVTSAGAALRSEVAARLDARAGAPAWDRLLAELPSVQQQFRDAEAVRPFVHQAPLAFRSRRVIGPRWILLPSAAGFVDPLLSTGFPLTLLGILRVADLISSATFPVLSETSLAAYASQTQRELELVAELVAALYGQMDRFESFTALTLLYFAAASFTETARRLGQPQLAGASFLVADQPEFGPQLRHCLALAKSGCEPAQLRAAIGRAIEPIDVAGLGRSDRKNWYPVELQDLYEACAKVRSTPEEIRAMLQRCGLLPAAVTASASGQRQSEFQN